MQVFCFLCCKNTNVNGFTITPGKTYNEVDVSAGTGYLLGVEGGKYEPDFMDCPKCGTDFYQTT